MRRGDLLEVCVCVGRVSWNTSCPLPAPQVRGASRRRGNPRPYQGKAHVGRPVEEVTEEELELVADSLTEKVYSSSTVCALHTSTLSGYLRSFWAVQSGDR